MIYKLISTGSNRRHLYTGYSPAVGMLRMFCGVDLESANQSNQQAPICKRCIAIAKAEKLPPADVPDEVARLMEGA